MKNKMTTILFLTLVAMLLLTAVSYLFYKISGPSLSEEEKALSSITGDVFKKISVTTSDNKKNYFFLITHPGSEQGTYSSAQFWKVIDKTPELVNNSIGNEMCGGYDVNIEKRNENIFYTQQLLGCEGGSAEITNVYNFDGGILLFVHDMYGKELEIRFSNRTHTITLAVDGACEEDKSSTILSGFKINNEMVPLKEDAEVMCEEAGIGDGFLNPSMQVHEITDSKITFVLPNGKKAELYINRALATKQVSGKILE